MLSERQQRELPGRPTPPVPQLYLRTPAGPLRRMSADRPKLTVADLQHQIMLEEGLAPPPEAGIYLRIGTRRLHPDYLISNLCHGFCELSLGFGGLPGGKGGFGSLLRSLAKNTKVTNFGACRDLEGRRIRHIEQSEELEQWKAEQAKRRPVTDRERHEEYRHLKKTGHFLERRMCTFGANCRYQWKCRFRHPGDDRQDKINAHQKKKDDRLHGPLSGFFGNPRKPLSGVAGVNTIKGMRGHILKGLNSRQRGGGTAIGGVKPGQKRHRDESEAEGKIAKRPKHTRSWAMPVGSLLEEELGPDIDDVSSSDLEEENVAPVNAAHIPPSSPLVVGLISSKGRRPTPQKLRTKMADPPRGISLGLWAAANHDEKSNALKPFPPPPKYAGDAVIFLDDLFPDVNDSPKRRLASCAASNRSMEFRNKREEEIDLDDLLPETTPSAGSCPLSNMHIEEELYAY